MNGKTWKRNTIPSNQDYVIPFLNKTSLLCLTFSLNLDLFKAIHSASKFFCVCILLDALAIIDYYVHLNVLLCYVHSHQLNRLYICNPLDKFFERSTYFCLLMKKNLSFSRNLFYWYFEFFVSKFAKFLNNFFRLILISITKWNFNQNERF